MTATEAYIIALNSGSSSLKLGCYRPGPNGEEELVLSGEAGSIGLADGSLSLKDAGGAWLLREQHVCETQQQALTRLTGVVAKRLGTAPLAVGHRIVHGGPRLRTHQRITPEVMRQLEAAVHLAPLHIPQAIALIQQTETIYPGVTQIACFDTTFHRTMPPVATHLPVPRELFVEGVQRYGFHGLSCESAMRKLGTTPPARVVIAHLGNGSSVTAVYRGKSVDTTMGLSPTGGVPMSTRTGDLDPEVLLYLQRTRELSTDALESYVNHRCGLAGVSGGESDMRQLLDRSRSGDPDAELAVAVYCTGVRKAVGGYAALLGGLDLLVFTGGIGENSEAVRTQITQDLSFLFGAGKLEIVVLAAEEERTIAQHCRTLMTSGPRETTDSR